MCNKCGQPVCCCEIKVISREGEPGKPGSAGPAGPGAYVESGIFTLSADGATATGGVLSNPGAAPVLLITTKKPLKLIHFNCYRNSEVGPNIGSYGKDNLTNNDCIYFNDAPVVASFILGSIAVVSNAGAGWSGKVTQINPTSFKITFTKFGAGLPITGKWHAVTGN